MRSISVPCGTSSTTILPAIICCWVSGLRPMWLAIVLERRPAPTSLPMPLPGTAVSFAMTIRLRLPCRTSSSTRRSGVPTPMNPPIMRLAPSGIMATASSTGTVFMSERPFPYGRSIFTADHASLIHMPAMADDDRLPGQRIRVERSEHQCDLGDIFDRGEFLIHRLPQHHFLDHSLFRDTELSDLFGDLLVDERRAHEARADHIGEQMMLRTLFR